MYILSHCDQVISLWYNVTECTYAVDTYAVVHLWLGDLPVHTYVYRDHAGGNEKLDAQAPGPKFYGGDKRIKPDRIDIVKHGDKIQVRRILRFIVYFCICEITCRLVSRQVGSLNIECLFTPCHTTGHICYYVSNDVSDSDPAVFTGDLSFAELSASGI